MMLYWGFCGEDYFNLPFNGNRSLTTAHHIEKPIAAAQEMMAMMGEQLLRTEGLKPGSTNGCFATRDHDEVQVMLYRFDENDLEGTGPDELFSVELRGLPAGDYQVDLYVMDRENHNTFRLWQRLGAKVHLTETEIDALRREGKIRPTRSLPLPDPHVLTLSLPAQSLIFATVHR